MVCGVSISQLNEGDTTIVWHERGPEGVQDMVLRVHNIVFSQIGAYAHSMVEFGCPKKLARQFVRKLATTYQVCGLLVLGWFQRISL